MRFLTMAERFIFKIKGGSMVVVDIGYKKYIMPKEKAMQLVEVLESAEVYEEKWWSEDKRKELGMTETYTYHVYPNEANFSMQIIGDSKYQMARLAGKPQEK
jgi:hypothetical protein